MSLLVSRSAWCHLHHHLVVAVVGASRGNTSHRSSALASKRGLVFLFRLANLVILLRTASGGWPGWPSGLGTRSSGDSATPDTTFAMVAGPPCFHAPRQQTVSVVCDLLLPDVQWQGEHMFLQDEVISGSQGAS